MLADDAGALDPLAEAAEELIEALPLAKFDPHAAENHPLRETPAGKPATTAATRQEQPYMIAGIAPATHRQRILY